MPKNDIGGFFVSIGVKPDKDGFAAASRLVGGVADSFNRLIGSARNAAVVLAGTAVATGVVERKAYKMSQAIGVSTETLNLWRASAKIAGVDANALVSAMSKISDVTTRMHIDGKGVEEFALKLGELNHIAKGIDIAAMLDMAPDEMLKQIIKYGQEGIVAGHNMTRVAAIMGDILGDGGRDFFIELSRQGLGIEEFLAGTNKSMMNREEDILKGVEFSGEVNKLVVTMQELGALVGNLVGGEFTQSVKDITVWLQEHSPQIRAAIENVALVLGKVAEILGPIVGTTADIALDVLSGDFESAGKKTKAALWGDEDERARRDAINRQVFKFAQENGYKLDEGMGTFSVPYKDLPANIKAAIDAERKKDKGWKPLNVINDGIVRPDGRVTQVAGDDWVIALRDIGDLARAFVPQRAVAVSSGDYVINQTINVNGASDMPQVIRQQAYAGARGGLLDAINESSRRLQAMSGVR